MLPLHNLAKYDKYSHPERASVGEEYECFLCSLLKKPYGYPTKEHEFGCQPIGVICGYLSRRYIHKTFVLFPPIFFFFPRIPVKNGISRGRRVSQKNITKDLESVKEQKIIFSPLQYGSSLNLQGR